MIARYWHPSRRAAEIAGFYDPHWIVLVLWSYRWLDGRWMPSIVDVTEAAPDTPAKRRHLRTLAIDWCAHGVSWPTREDEQGNRVPVLTRGGLPKRGVLARVPRFYEDVVYGTDLMGEYDRERAAVREVTS